MKQHDWTQSDELQCIIPGCSKRFTDCRGIDSHFLFTETPAHPLSKLSMMKKKVRSSVSSKESKNDYPPDWERIRRRILQRDKYQCQNQDCDAQAGTAELHVHHKKPLSEGGSNDLSNLITLCQDCHSNHHGWPIGGGSNRRPWWQRSGDDLLVRCGRCGHGALLQRNQDSNRIICQECGSYEITDNET